MDHVLPDVHHRQDLLRLGDLDCLHDGQDHELARPEPVHRPDHGRHHGNPRDERDEDHDALPVRHPRIRLLAATDGEGARSRAPAQVYRRRLALPRGCVHAAERDREHTNAVVGILLAAVLRPGLDDDGIPNSYQLLVCQQPWLADGHRWGVHIAVHDGSGAAVDVRGRN